MENIEQEEIPYYFIEELVDGRKMFVYDFIRKFEIEIEKENENELV